MLFLQLMLASVLTFVELNCENLFDTQHDEGKEDTEFLPESVYHWTPGRYWRKLTHIGQTIVACGQVDSVAVLPDLVALTEVENDSVMRDLTRRSPLRAAGYEYVMTNSPDHRGIDVALLYSPFAFRLLNHRSIRIPPLKGFRPTRDILYTSGLIATGDTLHVFVIHAPSRSGGEQATRPYRRHVAEQLCMALDSLRALSPEVRIIIAGDFNDYTRNASLQLIIQQGLIDVSEHANGHHGARGTYRYHGEWGSLDHILCDDRTARQVTDCYIFDAPFLLEEDTKYGGVKPRRNYLGPRYLNGFSDHLPLVLHLDLGEEAPTSAEPSVDTPSAN